MAENNQSWYNRYSQNFDRNKGRFNLDDQTSNHGNYGDASYGSDYNQNQGMRSNSGSAYSSGYGDQYNSNRGNTYGNRGNVQGQSNWQNMGSSYGNQQHREDEWSRNRANMGSAGMYGGDFGREDWDSRSGIGNDYNRRTSGSNYGSGRSQSRGYEEAGNDRSRGMWDKTRDEVSSWFGDDDAERRRDRDEQQTGSHRGKGPRGYHRSPERIREDVCERLTEDDRLDASNIEVQLQGDEVILTGSVNSREDKRRAEDLVESISGVRNVENRIRVGSSDAAMSRSTADFGDISGSATSSSSERGKTK